jgi:hypothetical protein
VVDGKGGTGGGLASGKSIERHVINYPYGVPFALNYIYVFGSLILCHLLSFLMLVL